MFLPQHLPDRLTDPALLDRPRSSTHKQEQLQKHDSPALDLWMTKSAGHLLASIQMLPVAAVLQDKHGAWQVRLNLLHLLWAEII
jgi:hypothetical protein